MAIKVMIAVRIGCRLVAKLEAQRYQLVCSITAAFAKVAVVAKQCEDSTTVQ